MEDVKNNAIKLSELIRPEEEVEIWSSPTSRTLQTSRIISETLKEKGVKIREKGCDNNFGVKVFDQLSEVKNFSWKLFYPLVAGGYVEFGEKKFFVDKKFTNPFNININEYFSKNGLETIDLNYKKTLPDNYVKEIESFEKFADVVKRLIVPLFRLKKIKDKSYRIIIVTHDVFSGFIANLFSIEEDNKKYTINPGEFINVERNNNKLVVTKVGEFVDGNKDADIIEEFNKKYSF
jgi:broad specificity phosphatase PhoE